MRPAKRGAPPLGVLMLATTIAAISVGSCVDSCGTRAEAQARVAAGRSREPEAVTLARMLCGEADAHVEDYAAILWTMQRRATAHHMSLGAMARAYSAPLRGQGGARGRWVQALPTLPTPGYARVWSAAVAAAASFRAGTLPDPCRGVSTHFGSRRDVAARWPGVAPIDCGPTKNIFFTERPLRAAGPLTLERLEDSR